MWDGKLGVDCVLSISQCTHLIHLQKDYLEDCACNCEFPSCLQFDTSQTELNFGNNTVETNHKIKFDDLIEQNMDTIFPACAHCGDQKCDLNIPAGHYFMSTEFHLAKQPVVRGHTTSSQKSSEKSAIKNV